MLTPVSSTNRSSCIQPHANGDSAVDLHPPTLSSRHWSSPPPIHLNETLTDSSFGSPGFQGRLPCSPSATGRHVLCSKLAADSSFPFPMKSPYLASTTTSCSATQCRRNSPVSFPTTEKLASWQPKNSTDCCAAEWAGTMFRSNPSAKSSCATQPGSFHQAPESLLRRCPISRKTPPEVFGFRKLQNISAYPVGWPISGSSNQEAKRSLMPFLAHESERSKSAFCVPMRPLLKSHLSANSRRQRRYPDSSRDRQVSRPISGAGNTTSPPANLQAHQDPERANESIDVNLKVNWEQECRKLHGNPNSPI